MKIKWVNVVVFALTIFTLYLVIKMRSSILVFLQSMGDMGPYHTPEEQIWGLVAFSLTAILLTGLLVILIQNNRRD